MVEKYITDKRRQSVDYSEEWQNGLNDLMYRQALTCVVVSSAAIINLYFSKQFSSHDEMKQLVRNTQNALNIIENIDEHVFQRAWNFGSRVIKLCEMGFSETK